MNRVTTTIATAFSAIAALSLGIIVFGNTSLTSITRAQGIEKTDGESEAKSHRRCSNHTIRGNYSYTAQGTILQGSPLPVPPGPFVSIGKVTLDGNGNITEHITNDNFNGTILPPINYTGTYTVDENCGGTAVLVGRAPYRFTIADGGNEIYFMLDAPGTVATGAAKRQ
jgi:hypothetical protein